MDVIGIGNSVMQTVGPHSVWEIFGCGTNWIGIFLGTTYSIDKIFAVRFQEYLIELVSPHFDSLGWEDVGTHLQK